MWGKRGLALQFHAEVTALADRPESAVARATTIKHFCFGERLPPWGFAVALGGLQLGGLIAGPRSFFTADIQVA